MVWLSSDPSPPVDSDGDLIPGIDVTSRAAPATEYDYFLTAIGETCPG